jgi:KUP system potassium uptake protein
MGQHPDKSNFDKISIAGSLIAFGIVYGDIGTSPLYALGAIFGDKHVSPELALGALSAVFWTLTLQTTIKYVIITLRADNNGSWQRRQYTHIPWQQS